jgi:hypothetical protein
VILLPRSTVLVDLRSTVHNYFESPGFGSLGIFNAQLPQSPEVPKSRSERSGDVWPLDLDDQYLLWEFGLQEFSPAFSRNSLKCLLMCFHGNMNI